MQVPVPAPFLTELNDTSLPSVTSNKNEERAVKLASEAALCSPGSCNKACCQIAVDLRTFERDAPSRTLAPSVATSSAAAITAIVRKLLARCQPYLLCRSSLLFDFNALPFTCINMHTLCRSHIVTDLVLVYNSGPPDHCSTHPLSRSAFPTRTINMVYEATTLIGEGAFGQVYEAKCSDNKIVSAVNPSTCQVFRHR